MAQGKHALGICDKTGFQYPLHDLVDEYVNGRKTGMKVGRDVADPDHPQNFIGRVKTSDNQSLRDPRPDTSRDEANALWGWAPIWNPAQYAVAYVGSVTVSVD